MTTTRKHRANLPTMDLYGEDGITVYVSAHGDILRESDILAWERGNVDAYEMGADGMIPVRRIIGHRVYPGLSIEQAHRTIREAARHAHGR